MTGAAGGAFAGILIANNIARLQKGTAAAFEAWKALEARGLALESENERPVLRGDVEETACAVRIVSDMVHNPHTEVTGESSGGMEAKVGIFPSPGGVLSALRDWLHGDIELGHSDFDPAFLVTAKPTEAAAALLSATVRERLLRLSGGVLAGMTYANGHIKLVLNDIVLEPDVIEAALDLVIDVARRARRERPAE